MKQFVIGRSVKGEIPTVCSADDVLGIIGEILSRVSELDDGDMVTIMCLDRE